MSPDFSPAMLKGFLRARVSMAAMVEVFDPKTGIYTNLPRAQAEEKARLRSAAGITKAQFDLAWSGRILSLQPRCGLWKALGVDPAKHGVVLVEGGQERLPTRRYGR